MGGRKALRAGIVLCGLVAATPATPAWAGSFSLFDTVDGEYKLTLGYALGMRMEKQSPDFIGGPVDEFVSQPPNPPDNPYPTFTHTGLATTINYDDGDRNFKQHSLINNRATAYGELDLRWGDYGIISSGAAFYDWVYHGTNDNDSIDCCDQPGSTVNKTGPANEFTKETQKTDGERIRLLDLYAYANWFLGPVSLDLRAGRFLNAWGESLFFPGIVTAQNPNDATKAFVPGAEVKEILLPVEQTSLRVGLGQDFTLLGYYQFKYRPTEIFPVGDYFSPADVVGDGATFAYGSVNPAYGDSCPGLLATPAGDLSFLCEQGGLTGPVINGGPYINAVRGPDILPPDKGQWGVGATWQVTSKSAFGAYYLRYHNHNPGVRLNVGFAPFGDVGGVPLSTETNQQYVPTSYNITYADNIKMMALSWSSVLFGVNFAGEFIHRDNIDIPVEATISGVVAPVGSRGKTNSAQVSVLYTFNPNFFIYDEMPIVAEFSVMKVQSVTPVPDSPGIDTSGDGDVLFYNRSAWAFQVLTLPKGRNVFWGWDLGTPVSFSWLVNGTPSVAGQFSALYGEGDMRISPSIVLQRLQNLEFALGYNFIFGDTKKKIGNSLLPANPYADRDYATFTVKYNL
ncbi:MAG TPA: DUF1302 family protein [Candidatus Binatia bacterium]|nr:DUF1302 family protein [Candidatus Binatia bacterium]